MRSVPLSFWSSSSVSHCLSWFHQWSVHTRVCHEGLTVSSAHDYSKTSFIINSETSENHHSDIVHSLSCHSNQESLRHFPNISSWKSVLFFSLNTEDECVKVSRDLHIVIFPPQNINASLIWAPSECLTRHSALFISWEEKMLPWWMYINELFQDYEHVYCILYGVCVNDFFSIYSTHFYIFFFICSKCFSNKAFKEGCLSHLCFTELVGRKISYFLFTFTQWADAFSHIYCYWKIISD